MTSAVYEDETAAVKAAVKAAVQITKDNIQDTEPADLTKVVTVHVERMVAKYGSRIAVGVDARDGYVAVSGWEEVTQLSGVEFCKRLRDADVRTVIYTDIGRDGCLAGANLDLYRELNAIEGLEVIASGGVSFESDVSALREMNIHGAIIGKALYEGKLDLKRCLALAEGLL